jgi:glutamyl-tRNA reductase
LRVANRSFDRAAELASRMNAEPVEWEGLERVLSAPDIIVASVGGSEPVLTREILERALRARGGKPIFVVDLGVPRNVAPDAAGLYSLYLYNIDDLGEIVEQNKKAREAEIPRAEALVTEHVAKFESWRAALEAGSIIDDLRGHFYTHRDQLIREHAASGKPLSSEELARMERLTEDLINRVLHQPTERMRSGRAMRGRLGAVEALRHLFGLDDTQGRDKE